jgi:DHA2 family multidrug resistance protein
MAIWGMGVMMGPIMGPSLGAWLTETYSWHWVFFVNLPFGIITVLGLIIFMDETKQNLNLRFDWFGFAALAIGIGSLQIALDRGEQLGWLESNEIIAEFTISAIGFYYFFAHSLTTSRPFIQFALFKDKNFVGGCVFMSVMGLVLYSTMALSSPFLQNVIGYPIITAGLLLATRGSGTFVAMMLVGRMMRYRGAHPDHIGPRPDRRIAVLDDRLDRPDRRPEIITISIIRALASDWCSCRCRRWPSSRCQTICGPTAPRC